MTHVTQLALMVLWLGIEPTDLARFDYWDGMALTGGGSGHPCCRPSGWWLQDFTADTRMISSSFVNEQQPTCPHCAVLCDMARGAE